MSGPIEGGTLITIEGSNLGVREADVRGKIRIGDVPCQLVHYEISVRIECRTGSVPTEMVAAVKVGNDAGYTESSVQFHYKDIRLEGLSPALGPQSGGTRLSVQGRHLNIGSSITAYLDDYECAINVTQASSSVVTCVTSASRTTESIRRLTLSIDGANRTYSCGVSDLNRCSIFNYTVDPRIMQIKPLKSFASGGRMVTVHGTNLDAIQKPEIEVYLSDNTRVNKSTCFVINANQMECPSPMVTRTFLEYQRSGGGGSGGSDESELQQPLLGERHRLRRSRRFGREFTTSSALLSTGGTSNSDDVAALSVVATQLTLQIAFVMDNVAAVRDLPKHFQMLRSAIVYVADPQFHPFADGIKLYKGDTLVIEGEQLNSASDETDVVVTIGQQQCNVTSLAMTQLVCSPPEQQPAGTDEDGVETSTDLPLVVVRVGRTLRFRIGYLRYDLLKPYTFSHAMAGVAVVIALIVLLLFVVLVVYRRKSTQAEREYKRIQIQMDTLESNVRMECKQAFAELQTDMTDLTADLENSGIPTLDHVNYIMKVFFPGVSDHPILNTPKVRNSQMLYLTQNKIQEFLLCNKKSKKKLHKYL